MNTQKNNLHSDYFYRIYSKGAGLRLCMAWKNKMYKQSEQKYE